MRIRDWSSDVCSSDLPCSATLPCVRRAASPSSTSQSTPTPSVPQSASASRCVALPLPNRISGVRSLPSPRSSSLRSEEHTSELQSLMRISYAVFCLKKKIIKKYTDIKHINKTHTQL